MTNLIVGNTYTAVKDLLVFTWEGDNITLRKDESVILLNSNTPRTLKITSGVYKGYEVNVEKRFKSSDLKAVE